jgi:hypothetical protein
MREKGPFTVPLIPSPPAAPDRDTLPLRLERRLLLELRDYAEFIGSTKEYVVAAALRRVFRHDKEFLAWQQARGTAAPDTSVQTSTTGEASTEQAASSANETPRRRPSSAPR